MCTAGRQLGVDMANNFMLMTLFSLIADTAEDPDGFRTDVKKALFDLADHHNLPGVAPAVAEEARNAAKLVIGGILQNPRPLRAERLIGLGAKNMAEVTYYVALPFIASDDGVTAGEPTECFNPNAAVMRAEALSRKEGHVGAVAFSRTGDPATGDFSDAKVIKKFGDVPGDLSTL